MKQGQAERNRRSFKCDSDSKKGMRNENSECRMHPKASIGILEDRVREKSSLNLQELR